MGGDEGGGMAHQRLCQCVGLSPTPSSTRSPIQISFMHDF